ncbi:hypothetical protein M3Y94_00783200 [Aphelenchoides besseyi]|nr:hypothetical protein M3Y94_00783200 [Aphelenchoides besseyi]
MQMFPTTISQKTWTQTQHFRLKDRRINDHERRNHRNQVILLMSRVHRRNAELKVEINRKKERKRKPQEEPEAPVKPKWIRPPLPQPDVYEMPPKEKSLFEILKEEKIAPTKRYAKKPKELDTFIPFVVPWEQSPALITQEGMGAFGARRNPHMNIKPGVSDKLLTLFEEGCKTAASQKGEHAFGSQRNNYATIVDSHHYESDSKLKLSESIIPLQHRAALCDQSNMSMGNLRAQTTKVEYGRNLKPGIDPESHKFLSRQFKSNSSTVAGSNVIDRPRGNITHMADGTEIKFDRASDGSVSRIFSIDNIEQKKGADFGSFRPLIQEVEGDVRTLTYDEERLIKLVVPYQTAASLR